MKRTTALIKPKAILTGDWHLREDTPTCRTDDFQKAQWSKVDFIANIQRKYNRPVIHAGDLFHHWKPSPWLLSKAIAHLPDNFYTIYGNHDLPQHNLELANKSGIYTLVKAGKVKLLNHTHWGNTPETSLLFSDTPVLIWHMMTWKQQLPYPGCTDADAYRLLRKYPQYQLIHTGHNHQRFTAQVDGRVLVNAGLLTRQAADQVDSTPAIYLWFGGGQVEAVELPIEKGVITRHHIEDKQKRDDRIDAFISRLDNQWEAAISFETSLEQFFAKNNVRTSVKEIIEKAIDM